MTDRLWILALPSAIVLLLLIAHSLRALRPGGRAALFWASILTYGVLRGLGVGWVTGAIGASFPYQIRNPLLTLFGVSVQEVAGWAIVVYLGWWVGTRFTTRLYRAAAIGALFLGAVAWAIEAAAIAARWWHWTVPTASRLFRNVPAIGIVDWFFVGIDFLLPFLAITGSRSPWRFATLLFFPAHFAGHLLPGVQLHVVHWILIAVAAWLALRDTTRDEPFTGGALLPNLAFTIIAADVAVVLWWLVRRPDLLVSLVPVTLLWVWGATRRPSQAPPWSAGRAAAALAAMVLFAVALHTGTARQREDLTRRLDAAIAERNRGRLSSAVAQFESIARDHPTSYIPLALAAEIHYRTGALEPAREKLERAVEIKQDFVRGYRLLAAIERQRGGNAAGWATRGLEVAPGDIQLRYLAGEEVLPDLDSRRTAEGMAALAYRVGDLAGGQRFEEEARRRWPER